MPRLNKKQAYNCTVAFTQLIENTFLYHASLLVNIFAPWIYEHLESDTTSKFPKGIFKSVESSATNSYMGITIINPHMLQSISFHVLLTTNTILQDLAFDSRSLKAVIIIDHNDPLYKNNKDTIDTLMSICMEIKYDYGLNSRCMEAFKRMTPFQATQLLPAKTINRLKIPMNGSKSIDISRNNDMNKDMICGYLLDKSLVNVIEINKRVQNLLVGPAIANRFRMLLDNKKTFNYHFEEIIFLQTPLAVPTFEPPFLGNSFSAMSIPFPFRINYNLFDDSYDPSALLYDSLDDLYILKAQMSCIIDRLADIKTEHQRIKNMSYEELYSELTEEDHELIKTTGGIMLSPAVKAASMAYYMSLQGA